MSVSIQTVLASVTASAVTSAAILAGFVNLQNSSPGTPDVGHINVTGNVLAGRFGSGTAPNTARVQVRETGTLQGVRAETNTGTAVFGKSTSATGLGAGGYFTSSSVGGRGIVGDALSTNGSTAGGLFYNRSNGGGAGVWGRALGTSGPASGVLGQTASNSGRGGSFANLATGTGADVGTGAAAIEAYGDIRMNISGSMESMVPIGYGWVNSLGEKVEGTPGWTVAWDAGGSFYVITFTGKSFNILDGDVILAVPVGVSASKCGADSLGSSAVVHAGDLSGNPTQAPFLFIAYSRDGGLGPTSAPPVPRGMTDAEWMERFPRQAKEYMARNRAVPRP